MDYITTIRSAYKEMTEEDQKIFISFLEGNRPPKVEPSIEIDNFIKQIDSLLPEMEMECPFCKSTHIIKNGHKAGNQRLLCKDCRKTFTSTNNSIIFSSKKGSDIWIRFLECTFKRMSLRKCAKACGIDVVTAFNWRHKILDIIHGKC